MKLIDTHSHLYEPEFDDDCEAAVARAREAGVAALLLPAIDTASDRRLFDLCRSHPEYCFPMIGLHPTSVNDNPAWREELARVERYLLEPPAGIRFCAIGEIGLDYYWSDAFVAQQTEAFVAQLRLAARFDLPVAIHTRAAWDDMCRIIEAETERARADGRRLRGVFHAFSEGAAAFERLCGCGDFRFGIGGTVTFKKSGVAEIVRTKFPEAEVLMGTSTAGIAHAAITATILDLPMGYVRSGAKDHGRGNRIEGRLEKGQKVVVIEDLISTAGSCIEVVEALREAGAEVLGVASIFTYGMQKGLDRLAAAGVVNYSLSNLDVLAEVAAEEGYIRPEDKARLIAFRNNPSDESWINK